LLHRFPQLRHCELISQSLGSAVSSQHYLAAAGGSSYGLQHTVDRLQADWLRCGVQGIEGLYLSGTDVTMAGLEGATMAGFLTAAAIDKRVLWRNLNRLITPYLSRSHD
jgi:phytoene dehydrogenase-like protein